MTFNEKKEAVKSKRACFNCMKVGHGSKACKGVVKCTGCGKRHYRIMCPDHTKNSNHCTFKNSPEALVTSVSSNQANDNLVLLKTLLVRIVTPTMDKVLRVLFDDGIQKTYIVSKIVQAAGCISIGSHLERNSLFGGVLTDVEKRITYHVPISTLQYKKKQVLQLHDKPKIAGNIPRTSKRPWMSELKKHKIWINDHDSASEEIDVLIGADLMPHLITDRCIHLNCGLVAQETIFGWSIMGPVNARASSDSAFAMTVTSLHVADMGENSI